MATETFEFLTPEISQTDLIGFSENTVNLKREYRDRYRAQVAKLREHLERYIEEHPEIGLVKMLHSGSIAKGTALSIINDMDVAVYVKGEGVPGELQKLLEWLVGRLQTTYHQIPKESIYIDGPCVVVEFSGNDLNVEVAPILYDDDPQWRGYMFDRMTGKKILTSIPLHLDFIRKRKDAHPQHFAQVVRLIKWWEKQRERDTANFKLRSFLIELLVAKLADDGCKFDDYHAALEGFFVFVQNTGLKQRISFSDYYQTSLLPKQSTGAIEIFDPVNSENNVAGDMTEIDRRQLIDLSEKALDALAYARTCQTKGDAVGCWQELMGSGFNP